MKIKHSKFKNPGILFELLVRQITADTLQGADSPAIDIIKKYFVKTELGREYKLYETILKSKVLNESRANMFITTALDNSQKLNRSALKKQKYNLIKEIRNNYKVEEFFGTKIKNYKELASLYTLIEGTHSDNTTNTQQLIDNKITLLEFLTKQETSEERRQTVLEEFSSYDKDTRILTYKVLIEKFNTKYDDLSTEQKQVLKEYINSIDSTPSLRNFYNSKIVELKSTLGESSKDIKDKATQIKVNEVSKLLTELGKKDKIDSTNLVDLLQYYELIKEIKIANGVQV
jgi:hypothetical protein|tara:strand:- start:986 stop:1849 length:864 start_codon:yes stop_codon:yes gene_type:complete